ncbi:MAG: flagellar biosynthetic protein FliO [Hespellia sp.]|jgi:flagellar biosynthetic protein FliO|nr:flagellar biosynthetic protein FliO [Hespellia sp.]
MWRVIVTFVVVVLIIYLSYLASKYIGKGLSRSSSSTYMRLVDQITLGQDRHAAIVQVGSKFLLIGVTAGQIQVLTELTEEELLPLGPGPEDDEKMPLDFRAIMEKLGNMGNKRR